MAVSCFLRDPWVSAMSEPTEIEQEQEAPTIREAVSGPLLPKWFTKPFYVVFAVLCVLGLVYVARSVRVQSALRSIIEVVNSGVEDGALSVSSPEGGKLLEVLNEHPVDSFLYLNQQILQDEEKDRRMGRALALRRAVQWGKNSARRDVIGQIVDNMTDEGALAEGFAIDEEMRSVLQDLIQERWADPEMTYAENRITDVLAWLAEGPLEPPKGPEKRRMKALLAQYAKRSFSGHEARALKTLIEEWSEQAAPVPREAAERFVEMLADERTGLSPEAVEFCNDRADRWENRYREGMINLAQFAYANLVEIETQDRFVDHPHIYQYLGLLDHRFEEVRQQVADGVWLLRHHKFAVSFLSVFATKTTINTFMAVETARLTREENERQMRRANNRRMRKAVQLLGRIGVDYIRNSDDYRFGVKDPDEFINSFVVHALEDLENEEVVSDLAVEALEDIRRADLAEPGGPRFFAKTGE